MPAPSVSSPKVIALPRKSAPVLLSRARLWTRSLLFLSAGIAAVYAMAALDVVLRGREAFLRGRAYWRWVENPEEKRRFYEEKFLDGRRGKDRLRDKGRLSAEEYRLDLDLLAAERESGLLESSAQKSRQWFRDAYLLYSPPETSWTRRARLWAPAALESWREDLRARNIPFDEIQVGPEAGEEAGWRVVFSCVDEDDAEKFRKFIEEEKIPARIFNGPSAGRSAQEGLKILVPEGDFWRAHDILKKRLEG